MEKLGRRIKEAENALATLREVHAESTLLCNCERRHYTAV